MNDGSQMGPDEEGLGSFGLHDLFAMLGSPGPVNWEVARQVAAGLATADPETGEPRPEPPIDPAGAAELVDLVRIAQTHVTAVTGLAEVGAVPARAVTRVEWTVLTLDALRPVLEALSTTLIGDAPQGFDPATFRGGTAESAAEAIGASPEMLAGMMAALAPTLFGVQAGSLVGLLAQHALGQYDLPLPLAGAPQLAFIVANIDAFAADWSIDPRDLRLALGLREVARCAPRSVPWVRDRLVRLASEYVSGYEMRPEAIEEQLGELLPPGFDLASFDLANFDLANFDPANFDPANFDPANFDPANFDPANFDPGAPGDLGAFGDIDPTRLLDALRSPRQLPTQAALQRFGAVLEGYVDVVVEHVAALLAPGAGRIDEALRRHRAENGRHTDFVDKMLGLHLDRTHYDGGQAFARGVVERAGLDGLNRLWERESMLPTENEFAAPGLWLARIELES